LNSFEGLGEAGSGGNATALWLQLLTALRWMCRREELHELTQEVDNPEAGARQPERVRLRRDVENGRVFEFMTGGGLSFNLALAARF